MYCRPGGARLRSSSLVELWVAGGPGPWPVALLGHGGEQVVPHVVGAPAVLLADYAGVGWRHERAVEGDGEQV